MKIKLIPHSKIDFTRYDNCVHNALNSNIFGHSWYLRKLVEEIDVLVGGDYEAVMPLPVRHLRLGGKAIIYHPLMSRLGVYSLHPLDEKDVSTFVTYIPTIYKNVQLVFNEKNPMNHDISPYTRYLHKGFKLDIQPTYDSLRSNFSHEVIRILNEEEQEHNYTPVQLEQEEAIDAYIKFTRLASWKSRLVEIVKEAAHKELLIPFHLKNKSDDIVSISYFLKNRGTITQLILASYKAEPVPQILTIDNLLRKYASHASLYDMNTLQSILAENYDAQAIEFTSLIYLRKREKWMHNLGLNLYKDR